MRISHRERESQREREREREINRVRGEREGERVLPRTSDRKRIHRRSLSAQFPASILSWRRRIYECTTSKGNFWTWPHFRIRKRLQWRSALTLRSVSRERGKRGADAGFIHGGSENVSNVSFGASHSDAYINSFLYPWEMSVVTFQKYIQLLQYFVFSIFSDHTHTWTLMKTLTLSFSWILWRIWSLTLCDRTRTHLKTASIDLSRYITHMLNCRKMRKKELFIKRARNRDDCNRQTEEKIRFQGILSS